VTTASDKPQIEDLKRLLERLEHVAPESGRQPPGKPGAPPPVSPPPLPPSAAAPSRSDGPEARQLALSAEAAGRGTAIEPMARPPERSQRAPFAAYAVAVVGVAGTAGLGFLAWQNAEEAKRQSARPVAAVTRVEQPPAPATAVADARARKPERADTAVTLPPPQPVPARRTETAAPTTGAPEPKQTAATPPVAEPPLGEAAVLRPEPQPQGRDKFDSEARLDAYLERGQKLIDEGDLTAARAFFRRAAESGDPRGALALGATYDANYFAELGIRNARPDTEAAGLWYRKAMDLGSKDAMDRIERLGEK
jgi:hypothetical protein